EQPDYGDLHEGPDVRAPLADAERDDRDPDGYPDEDEADDDLDGGAERLAHHEAVQRGDRGRRQRAADPDRVGQPVQNRRHCPGWAAESHPRPLIRAPSTGKAEPSSAVIIPQGIRNTTRETSSQVIA